MAQLSNQQNVLKAPASGPVRPTKIEIQMLSCTPPSRHRQQMFFKERSQKEKATVGTGINAYKMQHQFGRITKCAPKLNRRSLTLFDMTNMSPTKLGCSSTPFHKSINMYPLQKDSWFFEKWKFLQKQGSPTKTCAQAGKSTTKLLLKTGLRRPSRAAFR